MRWSASSRSSTSGSPTARISGERQGTGLGSKLIDHGHRRADELGLPCYLETFTEKNVRYYERRGYRVVGEYSVGDRVPVYGLIRPPGGTLD